MIWSSKFTGKENGELRNISVLFCAWKSLSSVLISPKGNPFGNYVFLKANFKVLVSRYFTKTSFLMI